MSLSASEVFQLLRAHRSLCEEFLALAEREHAALRQPDGFAAGEFAAPRRALLARLDETLQFLRECRASWQRLSPAERAAQPEISALLRSNQELTMRVLLLDRENEQLLLKRGLVPTAQLPPAQRQRPHFVADIYRRNAPPESR